MESVTQQNASFAEESASSAIELNSQAVNLKKTVDELVTLVESSAAAQLTAHAAA